MDYTNTNDNELIMLVCESNEEAKEALYIKYRYIVSIYVKKYRKSALSLGMELKDLTQEALVGFSDAINTYKNEKNSSLKTFISLCVERRIQSSLIKASRKKNQVLNAALSLEHIYQCFDSSLADVISDNNENNPLTKMTRKEHYNDLINGIFDSLSSNEKDVLYLMLDGLKYHDIASILGVSDKSVDNTIQRIKNKVKNIILINQ